jgi:hypothetical protein
MSYRVAALALAFTTLTACAIPRTAIATGAVAAIAGGFVLSDSRSSPKSDPANPYNIPEQLIGGAISASEVVIGTVALLVGAGLMTSGAIGLGMESQPVLAPLGPVAEMPVAVETTSEAAAFAPPGSATAALAARREQLTAQIWVESRAGHCGTATAVARRLAVIDRAHLIALIDRNPAVASCVAYKM